MIEDRYFVLLFSDENPPKPYSSEVLKNAQNWLTEQKSNATKIET